MHFSNDKYSCKNSFYFLIIFIVFSRSTAINSVEDLANSDVVPATKARSSTLIFLQVGFSK